MVVFPEINYSVTFITNIAEDIHSDSTAFYIAKAYEPQLFRIKKVNEEDKKKSIIDAKGGQDKIAYKHTPEELRPFEGLYYSNELNKVYKIKAADSSLVLLLEMTN